MNHNYINWDALVAKAGLIAQEAHAGKFGRDGKTPYIEHPMAVAAKVAKKGSQYEIVALVHDGIEESPDRVTYKSLIESGIPIDLVNAIDLLTHKKTDSYETYLALVKMNPIAKAVKIADMLHNLSDAPTDKQIVKYAKGLLFLME